MDKASYLKDILTIQNIVQRAKGEGLLMFSPISLYMDLEAVHRAIGLRLDDLLAADNFDFAHDILGIQRHMNRGTTELTECFLPRFARRI